MTRRIQTLGNLTLVAKSLNGALSNRPWTDTEAAGMTSGGEVGLGKRSPLEKYSLLVLSKDLIKEHPHAWSAGDIEARARTDWSHLRGVGRSARRRGVTGNDRASQLFHTGQQPWSHANECVPRLGLTPPKAVSIAG
ncbi:hypothetical protein GCM10023194_74470 [Planotetraspora phitsanulokensis]|uniref:GmrSD restriction endonucleases C-terminal domain-containing protein n=1 Tax=Planotetraspora phitsanulokensis TaxID=575192 RepID=A0A8J3XHY9_9ACTN|nr:hypothetical protein Pph01_20560 [Planotetraspora phitsanulokensis]